MEVETATQQLVWIPHEVLLEKGRRVPYRRANALVKYQSLWEKEGCRLSMCSRVVGSDATVPAAQDAAFSPVV